MAKNPLPILSAIAPFGRIGARLGWRWIFPVGTFPVPFHPWLFYAIPLGVAAWLAWLAGAGGAMSWTYPLWLACLLAIPLSIPFVQWVLLAFRLHVIQSIMLPAAMLLLALAVWRGSAPLVMAAIPALFFGLHLLTVIAGRTLAARLKRDNAAVANATARQTMPPPVLLTGDGASSHAAAQAMDNDGLDQIYYAQNPGETIGLFRIAPDALAGVAARISRADVKNLSLSAAKSGGYMRLSIPVDMVPPETAPLDVPLRRGTQDRVYPLPPAIVRLDAKAGSRWRKRALGPTTTVSAELSDGTHLRYHSGTIAPVSWFPGFMFLIYLQLGATAAFKPHVGFVRSRAQAIGKPHDSTSARSTVLAALYHQGSDGQSFDITDVKQRVVALVDAALAAERQSFASLLAAPSDWVQQRRAFKMLLGEPELYADRARDLCDAFARAREAKAVAALIAVGELLGALPDRQYHAIGSTLLDLLNSAEVAGVKRTGIRVTPEMIRSIKAGEPQDPLPLGGYGLMKAAPELYRRLGDLGEPARALITGLGERFNWPEVLIQARSRLPEVP